MRQDRSLCNEVAYLRRKVGFPSQLKDRIFVLPEPPTSEGFKSYSCSLDLHINTSAWTVAKQQLYHEYTVWEKQDILFSGVLHRRNRYGLFPFGWKKKCSIDSPSLHFFSPQEAAWQWLSSLEHRRSPAFCLTSRSERRRASAKKRRHRPLVAANPVAAWEPFNDRESLSHDWTLYPLL